MEHLSPQQLDSIYKEIISKTVARQLAETKALLIDVERLVQSVGWELDVESYPGEFWIRTEVWIRTEDVSFNYTGYRPLTSSSAEMIYDSIMTILDRLTEPYADPSS